MTPHLHPTVERIVRWIKPSAESFAAAAAVYGPELVLQLAATATSPSRRAGCRTR
jgi:hypothetical protein